MILDNLTYTSSMAERVDAVGRENRKLYTTANQNE